MIAIAGATRKTNAATLQMEEALMLARNAKGGLILRTTIASIVTFSEPNAWQNPARAAPV